MSDFVLYLMLALVAGALLAVLTALGFALFDQFQERRLRPAIENARLATAAAVSAADRATADHVAAAVEAFADLPFNPAVDVLLDLAHSIGGSSRSVLAAIAEAAGLLDQARIDLDGRWWWQRLHGARLLNAVGPETHEFLPLLDDRSPEVRAQAAGWAAKNPTPVAIRRLADMVSDEHGLCRFAARSALVTIGLPAIPEIGRLLSSDDDELVARVLPVAAAVGDPALTEHLVPLTGRESETIRVAAAAALGRTGDTAAEPELIRMLADESAPVRSAATSALAQLGAWPAAADIERLLADEVTEVRRDAAKALSRVGEVGDLLLRTSARGAGVTAAAAKHALDLKSLRTRQPAT